MNDTQHTLRRLYQQHALCEFVLSSSRFWALLWERQAGKSTFNGLWLNIQENNPKRRLSQKSARELQQILCCKRQQMVSQSALFDYDKVL